MQNKLLLVCCFVGSLAISLNGKKLSEINLEFQSYYLNKKILYFYLASNSDEQFLHKLLNVMRERFLAKINEQTNKISELTARIEKLEAKFDSSVCKTKEGEKGSIPFEEEDNENEPVDTEIELNTS